MWMIFVLRYINKIENIKNFTLSPTFELKIFFFLESNMKRKRFYEVEKQKDLWKIHYSFTS